MKNIYEILKAANRLPTPPGVAVRVLDLIRSETASLDDITQVIKGDPALTSKIMKFITSPLMGLGFSGTTVAEAVARIGMRGAQMVALSFSLVSQEHRAKCPSFDFDHFWPESLARAVAARCLAKNLRGWDPEEAFVTGLLARVGQLVFATSAAKEYEPVLLAASDSDMSLEDRERAMLGLHHLEAGSLLLRRWKLPEIVWKTAGLLASDQKRETRSARLIEVADSIARFLVDERPHVSADVRQLAELAYERIDLDVDGFPGLLDEIVEDWVSYGRLLSVRTSRLPNLNDIEAQAEEQRTAIRVASEVEVQSLRAENEQLGRLARHDRLTGTLNRAAFEDALPIALAESRESNRPLTLLMIDADRLKAINSGFGRRTADSVLGHLAQTIDDHLRKRDQLFRYAGGEFVVLAGNCTPEAATDLAEKLCRAVEKNPHVSGETSIGLSVSIGIATTDVTETGETGVDLIDYAEARLHDAKRAGRNCWRIRPNEASRGRWWMRLRRALTGTAE